MNEINVRDLSNKVAVVVVSKVATALIELAVVVTLARILIKSDVAIVALVLVIYQTARFLACLGLPETVFYFYERLDAGCRRPLILQTAALLTASGFLAGLVILGVSLGIHWILPGWSQTARDDLSRLLPILALVVVLELPTSHVPNVLLVTDRAKQAAWFTLLSAVGGFVALIGPLVLGYGVVAICWSLVLFAACRLVVSALWIAAILPPGGTSLPRHMIREQLKFSGPLALNALATRLKKYSDRLVVAVMLPAYALADYHVGAQEIPFLPAIAFGVGSVLIGRYVSYEIKGDLEALGDLWLRGIRAVSLIVIPATVVVLVLAEDVILLLFGANYRAAIVPFQIYTLILLVRVAQYGSILQAFGDTQTILRYTAISLAINLALNIPLTYLFGINGTAFATVLATYVAAGLYLRRIARHLDTCVWKVMPMRHFFQVLLLATVLGTAAYALRRFALDGVARPLALALSAAAFATVYVVAGRAWGLISAQQWSIVRGWVPWARPLSPPEGSAKHG